jgi:phosphoribosylglycinamide formyltransferase 2
MAGGRVAIGRVIVEGLSTLTMKSPSSLCSAAWPLTAVRDAFCEPIGHVQVSGDYVESWQPYPALQKKP